MSNALVLTAAGNSTRMGGDVKKEYRTMESPCQGRVTVLSSSLYTFLVTKFFGYIILTVPRGGEDEARRVLAEDPRIARLLEESGARLICAEGGKTRQESVRNGLVMLARISIAENKTPDLVLIHDGARPWVSAETIKTVIEATILHQATVPAVDSVDTQKEIDSTGRVVRHLDRKMIVSVQTPQGFMFRQLLDAHAKAGNDGHTYTDDAEIWGRYAGDVYVCPGDRNNKKITFPGDL
jgi:2-C-methyl-D-erythritol 4-phosphate cytidylyltransferase